MVDIKEELISLLCKIGDRILNLMLLPVVLLGLLIVLWQNRSGQECQCSCQYQIAENSASEDIKLDMENIKTEEDATEAFSKAIEAMLDDKELEPYSTKFWEMQRTVDKYGEVLYYVFGYSNEKIQKLLQDITVQWAERNFGGTKDFEKIKKQYLQGKRF